MDEAFDRVFSADVRSEAKGAFRHLQPVLGVPLEKVPMILSLRSTDVCSKDCGLERLPELGIRRASRQAENEFEVRIRARVRREEALAQ